MIWCIFRQALRGFIGQAEAESCAPVDGPFGPHPATMPRDDALYGGQTNPGSGKVDVRMEALEGPEKPVSVIWVEPHAIVLNEEDDFVGIFAEAKLNFGGVAFRGVFPRVSDQVFEHEKNQAFIGNGVGTGGDRDLDFTAVLIGQ